MRIGVATTTLFCCSGVRGASPLYGGLLVCPVEDLSVNVVDDCIERHG